ncbi:MAG: hypothetical protein HY072_03945 [Deltaproteobacteria bacterium]|nr:hypothetical protein [Deltaproteobacteria bacterium]
MIPYQTLFTQLQQRHIEYLVAGGFAVNFHQIQRATVDLDLIIHLERSNVLEFVRLMNELGYVPRIPVKAEELAEPDKRASWIADKGLMVFSFVHSKSSYETVDVFVQEPKPFAELYQRRLALKAFGSVIDVLGKSDLIEMKRLAGRDKDIFDIQQLEKKK